MNKFVLRHDDSIQNFQLGLQAIGYFDCVSEHRSSRRHIYFLGHAKAWSDIRGRDLPILIHWKAKLVIPAAMLASVQAEAIERLTRHHLSRLDGRWLVDIRSEARMESYSNIKDLVLEDIERGELANRLMHKRQLHHQVVPQIAFLQRRIGADHGFDWRRVRVDMNAEM